MKYKTKEKYPEKVLVWLALSAIGISKPYIDGTKGPAIAADIYISKCSSKLRSFIEEHHADDEYIYFGPICHHLIKHIKQYNGFFNKTSNFYEEKLIHQMFQTLNQKTTVGQFLLTEYVRVVGQ